MRIPHNFFLSHDSVDKEVAEIVARTLSRVSLMQVSPWFSSDQSPSGGLKPGNIWFNEILQKLKESKALVVLLTPNSITRPWIYFEAGIAQALTHEIIPVCLGIMRDSVNPPLGMYQCYQLTDYRSFKEFVGKVLEKFNIAFDEEMTKPVLQGALSELGQIKFNENSKPLVISDISVQLNELKNHLDKRLVDFMSGVSTSNGANESLSIVSRNEAKSQDFHTIGFVVDFPSLKSKLLVEIHRDYSVQDVLDSLFMLLKDHLKPYTYMEEWILFDQFSGKRMIMREIAHQIPARFIFKSGSEWRAMKIKEEYKASDSKKGILRRRT